MMRVGLGMVGHAYLEIVIFVCQDNHQPRGQQRTHAFRSGGGGYRNALNR